jgi:hypothetical protein
MRRYLFAVDGHLVEGIFRLAPPGDGVVAMKAALNSDFSALDAVNSDNGDNDGDGGVTDVTCGGAFPDASGIVMAHLIKVFLRELPQRLLASVDVSLLKGCRAPEDAAALVAMVYEPERSLLGTGCECACDLITMRYSIQIVLQKSFFTLSLPASLILFRLSFYLSLPPPLFSEWTLDLCAAVSKHEETNRMGAQNMAIVFAPVRSCFRVSHNSHVASFHFAHSRVRTNLTFDSRATIYAFWSSESG